MSRAATTDEVRDLRREVGALKEVLISSWRTVCLKKRMARPAMCTNGIAASMYYGWSKEFLEAGKKRLSGDTSRAATTDEVRDLRREVGALKEVVADLVLENRLLKKSMSGAGGDEA